MKFTAETSACKRELITTCTGHTTSTWRGILTAIYMYLDKSYTTRRRLEFGMAWPKVSKTTSCLPSSASYHACLLCANTILDSAAKQWQFLRATAYIVSPWRSTRLWCESAHNLGKVLRVKRDVTTWRALTSWQCSSRPAIWLTGRSKVNKYTIREYDLTPKIFGH